MGDGDWAEVDTIVFSAGLDEDAFWKGIGQREGFHEVVQ